MTEFREALRLVAARCLACYKKTGDPAALAAYRNAVGLLVSLETLSRAELIR